MCVWVCDDINVLCNLYKIRERGRRDKKTKTKKGEESALIWGEDAEHIHAKEAEARRRGGDGGFPSRLDSQFQFFHSAFMGEKNLKTHIYTHIHTNAFIFVS